MRLRSNYGRRKSFISFYREERERETLMTIVLLISSAKFCCSAPDTLVTGFISPNDAYNGLRTRSCLSNWICLERSLAQTSRTSRLPSFLPPLPSYSVVLPSAADDAPLPFCRTNNRSLPPRSSRRIYRTGTPLTRLSIHPIDFQSLLRTSLDRDNCRVNIYFVVYLISGNLVDPTCPQ